MKIVDVCEFYSPTGGGVKRYIDQKLEFAPRFGHELTVIAPGTENRREEAQWRHHRLGEKPAPALRSATTACSGARVRCGTLLDELKPDLVEGSSPWRGGWLAARWPGKAPKVFFMHMDPVAVYPQTFLGDLLGEERVDQHVRLVLELPEPAERHSTTPPSSPIPPWRSASASSG